MLDPILIMATPRSGSSMTAGIIAKHGVWTGQVRPGEGRNPKGFFENRAIRDLIREHNGALVQKGRVAEPIPGWRAKVEAAMLAEGYPGGPWMWKGSAIYWRAWFEYPNPTWIVCRRDKDATLRSLQKPPFALGNVGMERHAELIDLHHRQLDILVAEHGAVEVDTQAVAMGDFASIQRAVEHCGLRFDRDLTDDFVDRDQWHHVA